MRNNQIRKIVKKTANRIQNLSFSGLKRLYKMIINDPNHNISYYVNKYKNGWRPVNRSTFEYWSNRGWSDIQSTIRSSRVHNGIKRSNHMSPFSVKFWQIKINPKTNINYTYEESVYEANCRRPIRPEYWISKGYTETEAINFAYKTKCNNNIKGAMASKNQDKIIKKSYSKRCIDYWLIKGYSREQSVDKVSEQQSTFSLKQCIFTYGPVDGYNKWKIRQEKWQSTLKSKSIEDQMQMTRRKSNINKSNYILYLVKLIINNKNYIKIGLTTKNLNSRFKNMNMIPIEIYFVHDAKIAENVEQNILKKYEKYIQSDIMFPGYTETFIETVPLEDIKKDILNELHYN